MNVERFEDRLDALVSEARETGLGEDEVLDAIDARLDRWRGEQLLDPAD